MITCGPTRERSSSCLSCSARNYGEAPVEIFTVQTATVIDQRFNQNYCASCLRDLMEAIHPYRKGL